MRKFLLLLAGAAVLCVPAVSAAANTPSPGKLAAQMCRQLRAQEGKTTFRQTFHSFSACLRQNKPEAQQDVQNAARTCRAERSEDSATFAASHDGKTFQEFYGTNKGNVHGAGKNAFGKCVSTIAKQNAKSDVKDTVAAASTCKAAKKSDLATFQATYGTGRNAFGKCVSAQTKQG